MILEHGKWSEVVVFAEKNAKLQLFVAGLPQSIKSILKAKMNIT